MRQGMGADAAMGIAPATRPHGRLEGGSEAAIGINVLAAYHHVTASPTASHGSGEVDFDSVLNRSRWAGRQLGFMDRRRRW